MKTDTVKKEWKLLLEPSSINRGLCTIRKKTCIYLGNLSRAQIDPINLDSTVVCNQVVFFVHKDCILVCLYLCTCICNFNQVSISLMQLLVPCDNLMAIDH